MGTTRPRVHVEAATLAGGDNNQDRYAYGDGWAFVLDGATTYSATPPVHDGGWYAERLRNALAPRLDRHHERPIVDIVAGAIREAASAHPSSQGPRPTSTIALARWNSETVELYVLGDSFAVATTDDGRITLTDDRLKNIGVGLRTQYRRRLHAGHGFDDRHRELLTALQQVERSHRNRAGGYWTASDSPSSACAGLQVAFPTAGAHRLMLHTDGLTTPPLSSPSSLEALLHTQRVREDADLRGSRFPRSKPHDDITVVRISFEQRGP